MEERIEAVGEESGGTMEVMEPRGEAMLDMLDAELVNVLNWCSSQPELAGV